MTLYVGVVEWNTDFTLSPNVVIADSEEKVRAESVRDIVMVMSEVTCAPDEEIKALIDNPPNYADAADVKRWYDELWEITTDAMLTIYKHRAGSHICDEVSANA